MSALPFDFAIFSSQFVPIWLRLFWVRVLFILRFSDSLYFQNAVVGIVGLRTRRAPWSKPPNKFPNFSRYGVSHKSEPWQSGRHAFPQTAKKPAKLQRNAKHGGALPPHGAYTSATHSSAVFYNGAYAGARSRRRNQRFALQRVNPIPEVTLIFDDTPRV